MPNNRPTICTADGANCVGITSRVHWDVGGYDYRPNTAATAPQKLDSGENVRRARIGLAGKFFNDWNFALIYDFGGSSDGFGGTGSPAVPRFLPGGGVSGVENAYLSYTGLKPFGGKMAIEGGIMDLPYTLDEVHELQRHHVHGARLGRHHRHTTSLPATSARRSARAGTTTCSGPAPMSPVRPPVPSTRPRASARTAPREQYGAVARVAGQIVSGKDYSVHLGGDAEWLIQPPRNLVTGAQTLTLSDRPELRIDPTALISTGAIANVSGAQVYSVEAAATYGPLFLQGEYFWYNIDRSANTGLPPLGAPSLKFQGGYAQAGYVLTGEGRSYNAANAAYGGVKPAHPFSLEAAAGAPGKSPDASRTIDLNDQLGTATGIAGGRQTVYTAALNWYVNGNVRFMLDYLHGTCRQAGHAVSTADAGSKFDAVAMRTQFAF